MMISMMLVAMALVDAYVSAMTAYACIRGGDLDTAITVLLLGAAAISTDIVAITVTKEKYHGENGPEPLGFLFCFIAEAFAVYQAGFGAPGMTAFRMVILVAFLLLLTVWHPFVFRLRRRLSGAYESLFAILFLVTTVAGVTSYLCHSWIAAAIVLLVAIPVVVFFLRYFRVGAGTWSIGKP
ncbi:MAG: hypothetical protein HGA33_03740 [Candidatus Moranbacteria bacterium]|nr:hypothetical protein [Candidatus Moranbacteria bacterium]